jgi:SNF2 family DNA or RNA helicase
MGLGKTIQAIAAAEILARHFGVTKALVVCPASLKYQWQSEIARFTGRRDKRAPRVITGDAYRDSGISRSTTSTRSPTTKGSSLTST